MKRFLSIILAAFIICLHISAAESSSPASLVIGSSYFFGHYEQDNNPSNGEEPIEWIVLDVEDGRALLLSRYVLDCRSYNEKKKDTTWATSSLRAWLNNEFSANAFDNDERLAILTMPISNDRSKGNVAWDTSGGDLTQDRVFLLSYNEVGVYFQTQDSRKAISTKYAKDQGAKSIGKDETDWWLRSPGKNQNDAASVDTKGSFDSKQVAGKAGIRPALWIDMTIDSSEFAYERYSDAVSLQTKRRYADAAEIFESLGTYNDSVEMAAKSRYMQAQVAAEGGNFAAAVALYESLDGYLESDSQGLESKYQQAVASQKTGDYVEAIRLYGEVGQYKDSMSRLKDCFDKQGISVFYFSQDAVNAGHDTGYAKTDSIDGKDTHFGWRLGRFFMSGFTRRSSDTQGNPLFIKTLGDTVTLWFDLEQNIDCLNGNDKLIIAEDKNGYDEAFGVQKTNFGRGTLIIRHTDYQNAQGEPVIYTDYLLAKGMSGADTRVILQEEGDYEVALDYEIEDDDIRHITNKYSDYRVLLNFSIRNGNCMVYPFDVSTGAELQNTAITENGFTLDLARSRYLNIDVKYSVLTENASGTVEDERFNRPAKDGDRYTQEGIYTISVSNRYTGESTTKTIFVGSNELLQEYIANGFSMDRLK